MTKEEAVTYTLASLEGDDREQDSHLKSYSGGWSLSGISTLSPCWLHGDNTANITQGLSGAVRRSCAPR